MAAELTSEQIALRDAQLLLGRKFGLGGSLWDVSDAGGALGTVRLWVRRVSPTRLAQALAGAAVLADSWRGVGELGDAETPATLAAEALAPEQMLISQADSTLSFTLSGVRLDGGFVTCTLRRLPT